MNHKILRWRWHNVRSAPTPSWVAVASIASLPIKAMLQYCQFGSFAEHSVDLIVSISCWFPELMTHSSSIWTLLFWPNRYYGQPYQIRWPSYIDINIHSSYFLTVHTYIYIHCIQILYIIKRCGHLMPTHQIFVICCLLRASGIMNNIPQNITSY